MESEKKSSATGNPIRCKAAVSRKTGEPLVIEEVMVAPPCAYEVRVKIICTSLCKSDVLFWRMKEAPAIVPRILGHEAVGVVESVGEGVTEVTEGDVVVPLFMPQCGDCVDCLSEKSNLCSKLTFGVSPWMPRYEKSSRFTDLNGEVLHHFLYISSFSEYTVLDVANIVKIGPSIPPNRACLLGCCITTGFFGAWKIAKVEPGSTVAVFGLGLIGLSVVDGLKICGAGRIIGVDVNPEKSEIGKRFGITDFVNPKECGDKPVREVIKEMTNGGTDYCFECVGSSSAIEEAYASCRKGWGKLVVLGADHQIPPTKLTFDPLEILYSGKTITGSMLGGVKPKSDFPVLLKHIENKELDLDKYVTHELDFEEINKAYQLLISGEALRCVLWMPDGEKKSNIQLPAMTMPDGEEKSNVQLPGVTKSLSE